MKLVFVKKHTEGGAAGLDWEAGEVKAINSYLADELIRLSHGDYEIVPEDEFRSETTEIVENPDENAEEPVEPKTEAETPESKRPGRPKKSQTTESSSAE